jgi:hypothetical protein
MKVSIRQSDSWRLREVALPFQQTYATPDAELSRFVRTLLAPFDVNEGALWVEQIIFEPKELIWYLRGRGFTYSEGELNTATLIAENTAEVTELLECVLGQWTDFAFIPSPKEFVIYADHDGFTTVFTADDAVLSTLRSSMKLEGFKEVEDWIWTGPHSPGSVEEKANG